MTDESDCFKIKTHPELLIDILEGISTIPNGVFLDDEARDLLREAINGLRKLVDPVENTGQSDSRITGSSVGKNLCNCHFCD